MLSVYAQDIQGRMHSLPALCRLKISRSTQVPADSLRVLVFGVCKEEYSRVYVYDEAEEVFAGEVDEQIVSLKENSFTELICRSTAARLLDNEAQSLNFVNPSCELIFRTYAAPYGFEKYEGENRSCAGDFIVPTGISCYEVLERFSQLAFGKSPEVYGEKVSFEAQKKKGALWFADDGSGLPFTDLTHRKLRCRRISRIYAKTSEQGGYDTVVCEAEAVCAGVVRERYMDVSEYSDLTLSDVHEALEKARSKSEEMSLVYPGRLTDTLFAEVSIKAGGRVYEGFEVKALDYTLSEDKEFTKLTLCRKEKDYVDNIISG